MASPRAAPAFDEIKDRRTRGGRIRPRLPGERLALELAKKLSHSALS
jgi:hypothetical protein